MRFISRYKGERRRTEYWWFTSGIPAIQKVEVEGSEAGLC
jgi:hypothetical protein